MSTWRDLVTSDTKIMINKLCRLHQKKQKADQTHTKSFLVFISSVILLFIYFLLFIVFSEANLLQSLFNFFKNTIHILLLLIPIALFLVNLQFQSTLFNVSDQFEDLRHEVIDHLNSSWLIDEHTVIREEISNELNSLGINIRFKSIS